METATKTGMIVLLGETDVDRSKVNFEQVARRVAREIGFDSEEAGLDANTCSVILNIHGQDANIALGVHKQKSEEEMGAGDQGLMFGYATDEWDTETLHPYSHVLANSLCEEMAIQRKNGSIPWLRPDCKSQVIVEYEQLPGGQVKPVIVYNILIST
jgi:S-adenosylmethionine synthetase